MMQGKELKRLRKALGWTLTDVADLVGVSTSTIHNWEKDELMICVKSADVYRTLELVCKSMEQLVLVREWNLSTGQVALAPTDFGDSIFEKDFLILSDADLYEGATVLLYDEKQKPRQIGRILKAEGKHEYVILLDGYKYISLPSKEYCKVIDAVLHHLK